MNKALKLCSLVIVGVILPYTAFVAIEAASLSAASATDEVLVNLAVGTTISVSSPSDVSLGTITGTGATNVATSTWSVITNNVAGYNADIKSDTDPSMQCYGGGCAVNSDTIADYTPASLNVPETWSVAATDSEFGITVGGTAASSTFSNGGKFYNLTTTYRSIGGEVVATVGTNIPVGFKVEIGASKVQPTGTYRATTTLQVTTL